MPARWLALVAVTLVAASSDASPKINEPFPVFTALDVAGERQSSAKFRGAPSFVVAITHRDAGDAMRAWFLGANKRAPKVRQLGIISIDVPFFVSDAYARGKAREKIPSVYWHDNLFDTHRQMAKLLGLPPSGVPYVFVLDAQGRVVRAAHVLAESTEANLVWHALATTE